MMKKRDVNLYMWVIILLFLNVPSSNSQIIPTSYFSPLTIGSEFSWQITKSTQYFLSKKSWGNQTGDIIGINITSIDNSSARPYIINKYLNGELIEYNNTSSYQAISNNWDYWASVYNRTDLGWSAYYMHFIVENTNFTTFTIFYNVSDPGISIKIHYDILTGIQLYRNEFNSTEQFERILILFQAPDETAPFSWIEVIILTGVIGAGIISVALLTLYLRRKRE
ncbi:MAG: hypothetical protein HeimC3_37280 [Candidatus Heimdallarchaeota archaeon LC_3]|nr:MAG: hypothetical protein HeimC3_37280 [Candidatus Heimdallarchaeota archaeon LC_3]